MITRSHTHNGKQYLFEYTECDSFDHLIDYPIRQVRSVTVCDDKFVIVLNKNKSYGHPGGTLEKDETVALALKRELLEETSCSLIWWKPLGVQKVTEIENGKIYYQVRVVSEVAFAEFTGDPDDGIIACEHVNFKEMNKKVNWYKIGDKILEKSLKLLKENKNDIDLLK